MDPIIHNVGQYTPEWWSLRRGVATASEFSRIIMPKKLGLAAAHRKYIQQLIGDLHDVHYGTGERYQNAAMREGIRREPEARSWYAMNQEEGLPVTQVGFITTADGRFGCSPDALVGTDGLMQMKNPTPEVHAGYILDGFLPDDYAPQCYGELWVSGREWLDFMSYCPGFPRQFVVRIYREGPVWERLGALLEEFWTNYRVALYQVTGRELPPGQPAKMLLG